MKRWLSSLKAATVGTCHGFAPLLPALLLPVQAGSVPKLLLAFMQGMGPNHSHAGVKCLGGAAASLPMLGTSDHLPCSCQVPDLPPMPSFVWSPKAAEQRGPCKVESFALTSLEPSFPCLI